MIYDLPLQIRECQSPIIVSAKAETEVESPLPVPSFWKGDHFNPRLHILLKLEQRIHSRFSDASVLLALDRWNGNLCFIKFRRIHKILK